MASGADAAKKIRRLAHTYRLNALRAPAGGRGAALTAMGALQGLLTAIVLPGAAFAVCLLASGLAWLMALAVPRAPLARFGALAVAAMPVRSTMATASVSGGLRMAFIATLSMLALLADGRVAPVRVPRTFLCGVLMPAVGALTAVLAMVASVPL